MRRETKSPSSLYDTDFILWSEQQAAAIRERRWSDVDIEHVVEEIESLSKSQRRELRSRLRVLLQHLLKLEVQPAKATHSWVATIGEQANEINDLLADSPSLRREMPDILPLAYRQSRKQAARETGLSLDRFPVNMSKEFEADVTAALDGRDIERLPAHLRGEEAETVAVEDPGQKRTR